jgi:subtilisin family serine protease
MTKINAPSAWNITTGSSQVVVAVIDTGIDYTHPDLAANMFRNAAGPAITMA